MWYTMPPMLYSISHVSFGTVFLALTDWEYFLADQTKSVKMIKIDQNYPKYHHRSMYKENYNHKITGCLKKTFL